MTKLKSILTSTCFKSHLILEKLGLFLLDLKTIFLEKKKHDYITLCGDRNQTTLKMLALACWWTLETLLKYSKRQHWLKWLSQSFVFLRQSFLNLTICGTEDASLGWKSFDTFGPLCTITVCYVILFHPPFYCHSNWKGSWYNPWICNFFSLKSNNFTTKIGSNYILLDRLTWMDQDADTALGQIGDTCLLQPVLMPCRMCLILFPLASLECTRSPLIWSRYRDKMVHFQKRSVIFSFTFIVGSVNDGWCLAFKRTGIPVLWIK